MRTWPNRGASGGPCGELKEKAQKAEHPRHTAIAAPRPCGQPVARKRAGVAHTPLAHQVLKEPPENGPTDQGLRHT